MSRVACGIRVVGMRTNSALEAPVTSPALLPVGGSIRALWAAAALLSLLLVSPPARASDGVIEINQAKALAGGVTPGDAPGFPVTLTQEGSYRLTGNLSVAGPSSAIVITMWNLSLDLGGFTVSGPNTCTGYPTTGCNVVGGEPGIWANGDAHHVRVENGVVRSFNGRGVYLQGASSTAENLRVLTNGGDGISMDGAGRVIDCISLANYDLGVLIFNDGLVESSEARANRKTGIHLGEGGRVIQSKSLSNGGNGLILGSHGSAQGNVLRFNAFDGIYASGYGVVLENVADQNGGNGISAFGWILSKNVSQMNGDDQMNGYSLGDNYCGGGVFC